MNILNEVDIPIESEEPIQLEGCDCVWELNGQNFLVVGVDIQEEKRRIIGPIIRW